MISRKRSSASFLVMNPSYEVPGRTLTAAQQSDCFVLSSGRSITAAAACLRDPGRTLTDAYYQPATHVRGSRRRDTPRNGRAPGRARAPPSPAAGHAEALAKAGQRGEVRSIIYQRTSAARRWSMQNSRIHGLAPCVPCCSETMDIRFPWHGIQ